MYDQVDGKFWRGARIGLLPTLMLWGAIAFAFYEVLQ
jgi:hypothetical protein